MLGLSGIGLSRGGALAPAWVPTLVAGVTFWVRADKGVTGTTAVSAWTDQSGTGDANKDLGQATAGKKPALTAVNATYNNKSTIDFINTSAMCLASGTWAATLAQPCTVFLVGHSTTDFTYFIDGGSANEQAIERYSNGGDNILFRAGGNIWGGGATPPSSPSVLAVEYNGATSKLYYNALTSVKTGNAGAQTRTGVSLGAAGAGAGAGITGSIAECIIYDRVLSAPNFALVAAYLGARYGITIGA